MFHLARNEPIYLALKGPAAPGLQGPLGGGGVGGQGMEAWLFLSLFRIFVRAGMHARCFPEPMETL